ncbi:hypothetical protein KSS87_015497 [Heliosperma pusillum]|nr:hypothetical protein KSS87_015497 [Heliosperma pusillum]
MSPSAASVDTRAASDPNSSFNFNYERCSFNSGASSAFPSINKINNSNNQSSARLGPRPRPRLVKQRRSCKTTSLSTDDVDSGINPFRSVCSSNTHLNGFSTGNSRNCSDNNGFNGQFSNESFVFRVSNSNNGVSHSDSSMNSNNNNNNYVSKGADFVFGDSNTNNGASDCNGIRIDNNIRNGADVIGAHLNHGGFIFGALNSNNKGDDCNISNNVRKADFEGSNLGVDSRNVNPIENVSVEKEKVGEIVSNGIKPEDGTASDEVDEGKGKHGENGAEFGLSEELKKLKIERNERDGLGGEKSQGKSNVGVSNGSDQMFVFTSAGGKSDVSRERSTPLGSEASSDVSGGWFTPLGSEASAISSNGYDKSVNAGETSRLKPHLTNDTVFVFGSGGNSTSARDSTPQSFSFSAEYNGGSVNDAPQSLLSSPILDAGVDSVKFEACSVSGEKKAGCSFASMAQSSVASLPEFKLPDFDSSFSFSSNLPSELGRKTESSVRARGLRDTHSKKTKAKAKHSKSTKQQPVEIPLSAKSVTPVQDSAECYSPMDFSPYEETTTTDDVSLIGQETIGQSKVENGGISGLYTAAQPSQLFMKNGLGATMDAPDSGSNAKVNNNDENVPPVTFTTDVASEDQEKFAFNASSSAQNNVTFQKCRQKKKYRLKSASIAVASSTAQGSSVGGTHHFSAHDGQKGNFSTSTSRGKHEAKGHREQSRDSALSSAEKACDKWRRRGNDAYEKGDLSKAEDFYTWGVNCIPPSDASHVVFAPLVRCYSNRAATRMALGRLREAVHDCLMAVKLDPTFHRAQMRAANCYLQLGELEDAMKCFGNVIESAKAVCLDRQVIISASEGIRKSEKVIECTIRSAELLRLKTSEAAASALDSIVEAMSVSIYSEKLLEMKAEALCMLRRHNEAIALCHQTRDFAGRNFSAASSDDHEDDSCSNVHRWRRRALYKCHFHLGKLEEALDYIKKEESGAKPQESSDTLTVTIGELLREKSAGNTAFQSGKHIEAIEHYTAAIMSSMESRPFAAICFCNRAAAHQALGHIADAISDCSLAVALDETYAKEMLTLKTGSTICIRALQSKELNLKRTFMAVYCFMLIILYHPSRGEWGRAVSRRATLHELIRDYRQAAIDLQRLSSLLEKQSVENSKHSGSGNGKELRQVRHRLSMMEEEAKRDIPLDLYLILGVNKSDSGSEIKKAYRKAALRHHPDKAGQSLVRSDVGDEGRHWNDIAELVYKDSDRLFKMIGEAYAVLSDPTKREEYDEEEEMRKALKENVRSSSRRYSEHYYQGFPFERSSNRRNWQDGYRAYTNSYRRY